MTPRERWIALIDGLRVDLREGRDAPHKPLLVLLLLRRALDGKANDATFSEVEWALTPWLHQLLGKDRVEPLLPFWHLQEDGFWTVVDADRIPRR